jgi:hypothetical protein
MLVKFKDFKLNELSSKIYNSAGQKLRKLGHEKRADNLMYWSLISETRHLGTFNMAGDLVYKTITNRRTKEIEDVIEIEPNSNSSSRIFKKSPISCHFVGILGYPEEFMIEEFYEGKSTNIYLMVYFANEDYGENFCSFAIDTEVEWIDDNKFKLVDKPLSIEASGENFDGMLKFSDRTSANKFKRLMDEKSLEEYIEGFQYLREIFRFYSDSENWELYLSKLKNIPINQLFVSK